MTYKESTALIDKTAKWVVNTCKETHLAGGNPFVIIDKLTPELINIMVRNNLMIVHDRQVDGEDDETHQ